MKKYFIDITHRLEVEVPENWSEETAQYRLQNYVNNIEPLVLGNKSIEIRDQWIESAKMYNKFTIKE